MTAHATTFELGASTAPPSFQQQKFARSETLRSVAHALIPGGAHAYAKGDDQYPAVAPGFIHRGDGCHVWDVDGNEFIEYGMAGDGVTLGHGYRSVVAAASRAITEGSAFARPAASEVACAQAFLDLIDGPEMVKFARSGSEAATAAVKLARAWTGRDLVGICSDQACSNDDWVIGRTPMAAGIPQVVRGLTVGFRFNDAESVRWMFARHPGRVAALVIEAMPTHEPCGDFLRETQRLCAAHGALFILNEAHTGFRCHRGGAQALYGLTPDLSIFGTGMANGFGLGALAGRRDVMERGGLRHEHDRVFLLSAHPGPETWALAAALETMRVYREEGVIESLYRQGERLRNGAQDAARAAGVGDYFSVVGNPTLLTYITRDHNGQPSPAFRALFLQELIRRCVLAPSLVVSYSHHAEDVEWTIEAIAEALLVYRRALEDGVEPYLVGPAVKAPLRRFN